jgi:hypothetical protein
MNSSKNHLNQSTSIISTAGITLPKPTAAQSRRCNQQSHRRHH